MSELAVTSHVARDLLQSAEVFKTDKKVVWEYVANSLQYSQPGRSPRVRVQIDDRAKRIQIMDNGRGMSFADLQHFFTMHGENRERREGRIGRGMFGTGKSAAFGIAERLRVTSVREGERSVVALSRRDIERIRDGSPVPIRVVERSTLADEPNGTIIEIEGIHLKKLDRAGIVAHIERHLARYPRDVEVFVDHHECRYKEPEEAERHEFEAGAPFRDLIGGVVLIVRVAKGPLDRDQRGVQVFSYGNWHATTLAGLDDKKMAEYLFGEVEVPAIEDYRGPLRPYDNTRSGELNLENPVVQALYGFIGASLERVRLQLVERERSVQQEEEAKRLAKEARKIAEILSRDFAEIQARFERSKGIAGGSSTGAHSGRRRMLWRLAARSLRFNCYPHRPRRSQVRLETEVTLPASRRRLQTPLKARVRGRPAGGEGPTRRRSGGLSVEFKHAGSAEHRGVFIPDRRTILVNLDHPQVAAALAQGGVDDPGFIRLSWEVAAAEYALALSQELVEPYTSPDEAVFEVRYTIDRVARRLALLYL
ncbi:MAG: ATP-binding protein [Thermoanaerobaculia bacterium]|nr:ATP-binding protein [Thermoanaerobaculia bacterium]